MEKGNDYWKTYFIILPILLFTILLSGCSLINQQSNEDDVSEGAQKIIETFMTCPNEELYNENMFGYVGLGEELSDEKKAEINMAYEKAMENWENAIGDYFSENCLKSFINGNAFKYFIEEKQMEVESIELLEKDDSYEKVKVLALLEDERQEIVVELKYNSNGLLWQVNVVE